MLKMVKQVAQCQKEVTISARIGNWRDLRLKLMFVLQDTKPLISGKYGFPWSDFSNIDIFLYGWR